MNPQHRLFIVILAFAAAIFFGVFAAFGWGLSDLHWQDDMAAAIVALASGFLIKTLP